jgi:predicted nucleotidyltransferase
MIDLNERSLQTVLAILAELVPDCDVWAFGSRATGRSQEFSDLDLVLRCETPLDWKRIEALKDAFSQSDLPISVDILDWHTISESFRAIIIDNHVVLQEADPGHSDVCSCGNPNLP